MSTNPVHQGANHTVSYINLHGKAFRPSYQDITLQVPSSEPALYLSLSNQKNFRQSKAHLYRSAVKSLCDKAKKELLEVKKVRDIADYFFCGRCQQNQPVRYARLAHMVPLKQLWGDFEQKYQTSIDDRDPTWKKDGQQKQMWRDFHQENAELDVICKDCESSLC